MSIWINISIYPNIHFQFHDPLGNDTDIFRDYFNKYLTLKWPVSIKGIPVDPKRNDSATTPENITY